MLLKLPIHRIRFLSKYLQPLQDHQILKPKRHLLRLQKHTYIQYLHLRLQSDVNIVALSLADTTEYGMLRMIVSDPNKGKAVLKENGITAMLTDVIALRVPHETGSLSRAILY